MKPQDLDRLYAKQNQARINYGRVWDRENRRRERYWLAQVEKWVAIRRRRCPKVIIEPCKFTTYEIPRKIWLAS